MLTPTQIKNLREALDLTQAAFAKKLGVRQPTVAYWETGVRHPRYDLLVKLWKIFQELERQGLVCAK